MVPPLELKLNRVICPKSVATSKPMFFWGGVIYIYIWRFSKIGVPPHHPKLDHFSIETLVLGYAYFTKPPYKYI